MDVVSNLLPKCPVPVLMSYRTYRSVRYRYGCCAEHTEVSGTGIDVVPNLPKCQVPGTGTITDVHTGTGGICSEHTRYFTAVDVVDVLFTNLTDRASTIPSNIIHGCQSGTLSAGQLYYRLAFQHTFNF